MGNSFLSIHAIRQREVKQMNYDLEIDSENQTQSDGFNIQYFKSLNTATAWLR